MKINTRKKNTGEQIDTDRQTDTGEQVHRQIQMVNEAGKIGGEWVGGWVGEGEGGKEGGGEVHEGGRNITLSQFFLTCRRPHTQVRSSSS